MLMIRGHRSFALFDLVESHEAAGCPCVLGHNAIDSLQDIKCTQCDVIGIADGCRNKIESRCQGSVPKRHDALVDGVFS